MSGLVWCCTGIMLVVVVVVAVVVVMRWAVLNNRFGTARQSDKWSDVREGVAGVGVLAGPTV